MDPDQTQQPQLPTDTASFNQVVLAQWQRLQQDKARQQAIIDSGGVDPVLNPDGKNNVAAMQVARNNLDKLNSDERSMLPYLKPPAASTSQAAPTTKTIDMPQPDGSVKTYTYRWNPKGTPPGGTGATGAFELDTSIPPESKAAPAGSRPPSDPASWVQIHANPADPTSKVIALQDPSNSSNRVTVPADANAQKPTVVDGQRGQKFSWDGTTLKELRPAEPDKRQIVQGQGGSMFAWDGQNLTTLQPGSQPKNGDTMTDVVQGRYVTKTYQNGNWGTTQVGASAIPGAPQPGDTRPAIENDYHVTQTYEGGEWKTTDIGARAVPEKPTQVTAGADQPYITTMDASGKLTSQANPSFQPKTLADVQARIGQIQTLMQQKSDEVQARAAKGDPSYTAENALKDYNTWYDANVAPQLGQLDAVKQQAYQQQALDQMKARTSAASAAEPYGTGAVNAFKALQAAHPVTNPEFYAASAQLAKGQTPTNPSALTWKGPNPVDLYQKGTMNALKYIDPTAAQANGLPAPNFQNVDVATALGRNQYAPPGAPAPPPSPPLPPGAPNPPGTRTSVPTPELPTSDWFSEWQNRQAADVLAQRQQALVPNMQPTPPAAPNFGAIPTGNPWDQYAPDYAYP